MNIKTKKTIEDFQEQARKKGINYWYIASCTMCNYRMGYSIIENAVLYDNGCDCYRQGVRNASWEEIADHYNMQSNANVIARMNEFWGF